MAIYNVTEKDKGYIDGIKAFYKPEEIEEVLIQAIQKQFPCNDSLEGRAYMVIKELPDAKRGTVLRPAIDDNGDLSTKTFGADHYNYSSKYVGRRSVLHKEIVHQETSWFTRIN